MALQVEDIYDVLDVKCNNNNVGDNSNINNDVEFVLMMDQSSGHGRMREGALNANNMGVRFGARQG